MRRTAQFFLNSFQVGGGVLAYLGVGGLGVSGVCGSVSERQGVGEREAQRGLQGEAEDARMFSQLAALFVACTTHTNTQFTQLRIDPPTGASGSAAG